MARPSSDACTHAAIRAQARAAADPEISSALLDSRAVKTRPAALQISKFVTAQILVLVSLFLGVRLGLQPWLPHGGTPKYVYAGLTREARIAVQRGTDRYSVHRNLARMNPNAPTGSEIVEYPPLALAFMDLAAVGMSGADIVDFSRQKYARNYAWLVFGVDLAGFGLLLLYLFRFSPARSPAGRVWPALFYVFGGLVQSFLLHHRLDLPVGVMLAAAAVLAVRGAHWMLPLAILALAVAFKIAPILLLPVFVLGTLPVDWRRLGSCPRLRAVAVRLAGFAAVGVALTVPFVWADGLQALEFVTFHADRGLHNESLLGGVVLALVGVGLDVEIVFSHGAHDLVSPLADVLAKISHWASLLVAALVAGALLRWWRPSAAASPDGQVATLAVADPDVFLRATVLALAASLAAASVLSAQYVLWLLPLVPLLDWSTFRRTAPVYMLVLVLTALVYPWLYADLSGVGILANDRVVDPPHAPGVATLLARNVALLVFVLCIARDLFRRVPNEPCDSMSAGG